MYYAINHDPQLDVKRMTVFGSRSERDAWVDRHVESDAFAVTARQAERWIHHVFEVDTNGTDAYNWIDPNPNYPEWLDYALAIAVDAYGTYERTVYVLA